MTENQVPIKEKKLNYEKSSKTGASQRKSPGVHT
jgi:hypothetical protein